MALAGALSGCARLPLGLPVDSSASNPSAQSIEVAKGEAKRVDWFYSLTTDCREQKGVSGALIAPPRHGTVTFQHGNEYPTFAADNPHSVCNDKLSPVWFVVYKPKGDFTGDDSFTYDKHYADIAPDRITVDVVVR